MAPQIVHIGAECTDCKVGVDELGEESFYLFVDWSAVRSLGYPIGYWRCKNQYLCEERRKT